MILTDDEIFLILVMLCATVIPICLYVCIEITKDINEVIRNCDHLGAWAKEELERRNEDD